MQDAYRKMQEQEGLRQLFQSNPNPDVSAVMQTSPEYGLRYSETQMNNRGREMQYNEAAAKVYAQYMAPLSQDYFDAVSKGMPPQQAEQQFRQHVGAAQAEIEQRYGIKPMADFTKFTPEQIANRAHSLGVDVPYIKQREEEQKARYGAQLSAWGKMQPSYGEMYPAPQLVPEAGGYVTPPSRGPQSQAPYAAPANGQEPRGIRNNNPGNLQFANQEGATLEQGANPRFARFETPEAGIQALDHQLQLYGQRGLNTVSSIMQRYAPPSENNTGQYAATVARAMGVSPDQPIDLGNPMVRQHLSDAIIRFENGKNPYSSEQMQGITPVPGMMRKDEELILKSELQQEETQRRIQQEKQADIEKETAKNELARKETAQNRSELIGSLPSIDEINNLIDKSISSKAEELIKGTEGVAGYLGINNEAQTATKKLEVYQAQLTSLAKSLIGSGSVSDFEQKLMQKATGEIANPKTSPAARKAAFEALYGVIRNVAKKYPDVYRQMTSTQKKLKIGDVKNGHQYLGGNPKDQASWQEVQ